MCRSTHRSIPKTGEKSYKRVQKLDDATAIPSDDSSDEYVYAMESEECGEEV